MTEVEPPQVDHWADRIRPHLVKTVEGIIGAGRELIEAKAALPHGQFGPLLDELGLSSDMAQRFMRVARHAILSNPAHVQHLPLAVSTLDELTRWDDDDLAAAIEADEITRSTTRVDALSLAERRGRHLDMNEVHDFAQRLNQTVEDVLDDINAFGWPVHPFLKIIPPMRPHERLSLIESIAELGCIMPVTVHEGVLIDGRERVRACRLLRVRPPVEGIPSHYRGGVLEAIISSNLGRQHLSDDQLAIIAADGESAGCWDAPSVLDGSI